MAAAGAHVGGGGMRGGRVVVHISAARCAAAAAVHISVGVRLYDIFGGGGMRHFGWAAAGPTISAAAVVRHFSGGGRAALQWRRRRDISAAGGAALRSPAVPLGGDFPWRQQDGDQRQTATFSSNRNANLQSRAVHRGAEFACGWRALCITGAPCAIQANPRPDRCDGGGPRGWQ